MRDDALRIAVGRLLMVGVRGAGPGDDALRRDIDACIEARCRAVILFDRDVPSGLDRNILSPTQAKELTSYLRDALGDDTLVAIDQEGGTVQRLRAARGFVETPSAADLARMSPDDRRGHHGALAAQLRDLGIGMNFAPCVDIAIRAESPIIAARGRSFGADPGAVAALARESIEAHRLARVVPCMKHFPGHGSASSDSHLDLPDITRVWDEPRELSPFAALAREPNLACMTGHLLHRAVDPHRPASLSRAWTTGLLRARLGFDGVVVTDSLDMRAVSDRFPAGAAAAEALAAGADLALDANNMPGRQRPCPAPEMAAAVLRAVDEGRIEPAQIERSAARVASAVEFTRAGDAPPPMRAG